MSVEIIIGAVGALASLAAGLTRMIARSREKSSESVTVTVRSGAKTIEKQGMLRPEDASRVLKMVEADGTRAARVK
jgi:hypothetical protein